MIRRPKHAGTFYPETKGEIEKFFAHLESELPREIETVKEPKAVVVPHAGYVYSGKVAYTTYKSAFSQKVPSKIVIMGPSHYVYLEGIAVYGSGKWVTPLGEVDVDESTAKKIIEKSPVFVDAPHLHEREHSLEVQLPFLQHFAHKSSIIPLLVGDLNYHMMEEAGKVLAELINSEPDLLIVTSSDLYHGYSYQECVETDKRTIKSILEMDPKKFFELAQRQEIMACGEMPIAVLLSAMKNLSRKVQAKLVSYTNSADVTRIKHGYVVGYAGVVMGYDQ